MYEFGIIENKGEKFKENFNKIFRSILVIIFLVV